MSAFIDKEALNFVSDDFIFQCSSSFSVIKGKATLCNLTEINVSTFS